MTHTHETLLTVQELSQLLKVKPDTIYHWNLRNAFPEIKRVKIAGKVYFKLSSIADLIND
ncbi:MAG: helix-turn-helix domain-containing protein [Alphaproteobacteria bacterium]|nr:helix-turn-helix domain-containing protein [Alphaproteobacteria bacterium]